MLEAIEALVAMPEDDGAGDGPALDGAYRHLEEELGDVLFQVFFHAVLGTEAGRFNLADVARGIHDKLVRRHPHVFAGVEVAGTDDVMRNWEQIKKQEKGRTSVMDGVASNLPSLLYAFKVQRKAATVGVDVAVPGTLELSGLSTDADLGSALFAVVAAGRRAQLDPEAALRAAAARFRDEVVAGEASGARPG